MPRLKLVQGKRESNQAQERRSENELLLMARAVLESDDISARVALERNIIAFYGMVKD